MKKMLSVLLASAMAISAVGSLAACGKEDSKTIVVWAPQAAINGYESIIAEWKDANPDYKDYTVTFNAVDEGEVETKLNTDASNGADVFFFEAGQIAGLQEKNLLQNLGAEVTAEIKARDEESWYNPVMNGTTAVAFPTTADNGYFLWYDRTVFTADDVKSLDKMVEIAKEKGKNIMFDYANGWYLPTFWFGDAGCIMDYVEDDYVTDIDNDTGKAVAKAVNALLGPDKNKMENGKPCIIKQSKDLNSEIGTGFASGTVAAGVIGTWVAEDIETKMSKDENNKPHDDYKRTDGATYDDIKCAKLPSLKVGTNDYQMGSFMGGKYCGVNAQKKTGNIAVSISLANFLTGERGQAKRFETTKAGPTNKKVAATSAVQENKALAALSAQNAAGGYLQLQQSSNFWTAWETFGNGIYAGDTTTKAALSETALMTALSTLATTIKT